MIKQGKLIINHSSDVQPDVINGFGNNLKEYVAEINTHSIEQKSSETTTFISLLADSVVWAPIAVAASAFLARIGKRAADDIWENKEKVYELVKDSSLNPLRCLVNSIVSLLKGTPKKAHVSIGIPYPDDFFGTSLEIGTQTELEIIQGVVTFLTNNENIKRACVEIENSELTPLGGIFVRLNSDGKIILEWMSRDNLKKHQRVI